MVDLTALTAANLARWNVAKVWPELMPTIKGVATRLIVPIAKSRYQTVSAVTDVPWFIIAVIHERESSQSWAASLAQGDPWNAASIHVPKGRGPFDSWEAAAIDALSECPPHAANWPDWTAGGSLTLLEMYNGLGYAMHGAPSPYIWASTDQYKSGKYIADGHYDPNAIDHQLGCASLIAMMMTLDATIQFTVTP
jgi:lysozyme family protein